MGKETATAIYNEYYRQLEVRTDVPTMLKKFKQNPNTRTAFLIKSCGASVPITVLPKSNLVYVLRQLFAEYGGGKLYVKRTISTAGKLKNESDWQVYIWGGGRQHVKNIKEINVLNKDLPKILQLMDMLDA